VTVLAGVRVRMLAFRSHDRVARLWRAAEAVAGAGAQVDLVALRRPGQPGCARLDSGVRVIRATGLRPDSRRPWHTVRAHAAVVRAIGPARADVYHCLDGATLALGAAMARRDGAKVVYDASDYFTDHLPAAAAETRIARLRRRYTPNYLGEMLLIRRADLVLTVSDGFADLLTRRYRLPSRPAVVTNANPYWRPADEQPERLRKVIGADPAETVVVFLGSIHEKAEYALAGDRGRGLDAVVDVVASLPGVRLAIIGAAPSGYPEAVRARAGLRDAASRVSFLGCVEYPEYLELAAGGDVGVYLTDGAQSASFANTVPNRLSDFVMARLPLVAGSGTATARVVRRYDIGAVVGAGDTAAITAAIAALATGPRRERCRTNLERAACELSWERHAERLVDLYSELVAGA
jgi:glycosyltransferase involved in cell wall biosynthesis